MMETTVLLETLNTKSRHTAHSSSEPLPSTSLCTLLVAPVVRHHFPFIFSERKAVRSGVGGGPLGGANKSIYIHSKTSPISTYPERPLSKEEATAPKPP